MKHETRVRVINEYRMAERSKTDFRKERGKGDFFKSLQHNPQFQNVKTAII